MKQNFQECLKRLLVHEGGYSNHPSDPGGPTNYGITITDYRKYIDKGGTASDVKNMSIEDAKRIYKSKYWDAMGCDSLPSGVDYVVFDYGVNSGVSRSLKVLKQFDNIKDPIAKINAICDERMAFLKRLKTWPVFGTGWSNRVKEVRAFAIKLAGTDLTVPVVVGAGGSAVLGLATVFPYLALAVGILVVGFIIYKQINKSK